MKRKNKKILRGSVICSLALHVAALAFLQRQSLWFSSPPPVESQPGVWTAAIEKKERDHILKQAFDTALSASEEKIAPSPQPERVTQTLAMSMTLPDIEESSKFVVTLASPTPFPENPLLNSPLTLSFSLPPQQRINLFEHLPKGLIFSTPPSSPSLIPSPALLPAEIAFQQIAVPTPLTAPTKPAASASEPLLIHTSLSEKAILTKAPSFIPTPHLPKIPSLYDLQTADYSGDFDTELVFAPKEEGGYIFALTLIPRPDLSLIPIQQNYLFLIDRSNSIQADRLLATKNAVRKALEEMNERDTFNIFVFDSKIEKLASMPLSYSEESCQKAVAFLNNIELGSFFSQADLFKPLFLTIPSAVGENELYTAILLTDGEGLAKKGVLRSLLDEWTHYNEGRVSLFAVGMNSDSHLATLEAITSLNRGKAFASPTNRGLKRKLLKLMKTVQAPVAKNLACKAISRGVQKNVSILSNAANTPHLYLNEPYILLGETDSLEDFVLFVQGRLNGEWLHIKKTISFLNGKKGESSLKAEWAFQKAFQLYDQYCLDQNPSHIAEARSLLEPHGMKMLFE